MNTARYLQRPAYCVGRILSTAVLCLALMWQFGCSDSGNHENAANRATSAEVIFDITPDNATIYMPGLQRPLNKISHLGKGRFLVEFSAPGYEKERLWLEIDSFQQQHIQLALTPKSESIKLDVWPPGSDMTWRNQYGENGVVAARGEPRLALGRYSLTFNKPGYIDHTTDVTIQEGGEYALNIRLNAKQRRVGEVFSDRLANGSLGPAMVTIAPGNFVQGDIVGDGDWRELPTRRVSIKSFSMGQTEVTRGQYHEFSSAKGWPMPAGQEGDDQLPVSGVSYDDANAFAAWLSEQTGETYRLPSESEWEYAARAGSQANYSKGEDIDCTLARYDGLLSCGVAEAAPVGSYQANAFGLFDMHGNLWEWSADCASEDYSEAPLDGSAYQADPCHRAMVRGGSYILNAHKLRVSYRNWRYRDYRHSDTGFRLVREL